MPLTEWSDADARDLIRARTLLESPGIAAKIADILGGPLESALNKLSKAQRGSIEKATVAALERAVGVADWTLDDEPGRESSSLLHMLAAGFSGAVGGAMGLAALPIELPASTGLMIRSMGDIARSEGERMNDPGLPAELLSVFAMGGSSSSDDGAESGYFAVRAALAAAVTRAAESIAAKGGSAVEGPVLARLIASVAQRFQVQVTQKAAAQIVPVIGGVSGAAINTLFMDHFQSMARGHFIVRRLERKYGSVATRSQFCSAPS